MTDVYLEVNSGTKVFVMTMEIEVMAMPTMGDTESIAIEDTGITVEMVGKAGIDQIDGEEVVMDSLYDIDAASPGI